MLGKSPVSRDEAWVPKLDVFCLVKLCNWLEVLQLN